MRLVNRIVLASTSRHKLTEYLAMLGPYPGLEVIAASKILRNAEKLGFVENYATYLENTVAKVRVANQGSHYPCLADDTGLEVDALNGHPGVRTHRYAVAKAGQSQDHANMEKLLTELKGRPMAQRNAKFVTALALQIEGVLLHSTGILEGTIAEAPAGSNGFGYDPIFIPKGSNRTLAEMGDNEKNSISHRGRAFHDLMAQVKARGIIFAKP